MPTEPKVKRAITFIDGQNLFHVAREAFDYTYPNYDILCLSRTVCQAQGWNLAQACFYTGIPDFNDDYFWSRFWAAKLLAMTRQGIHVFS